MRSPPKRLVFTKTRLESLPIPDAGRTYYNDSRLRGLALCVTATGGKTFYYIKKIDGRTVRVRLGTFPDLPLERARKLAGDLLAAVAAGRDPQAEKQARRQEATLQDLFDHWMIHAKARKRSWRHDDRQFKAYLKPWSGRRLSAIKKANVAALHRRMGSENGPYAANRVLSLLRSMFNQADGVGWSGQNPARGIKPFSEESRDRFLKPGEMPAFFKALAEEPNPFHQGFFMVCLLSGARRGNVLRMRWEEIDFTTCLWRIPQTKAGVPMVVPLCPPAIDVLRKLQTFSTGSEWVFPAMRSGKHNPGHLTDPMPAWRRLCKRAGLADLRIHDLRRSTGSWQALTGASLLVIGKSLGHTRPETTMIYSRLAVDPIRESLNAATTAMFQAGGLLPKPDEHKEGSTDG